jgi:transcriptional regulator with XRE-family HTH domain
MIKFSKATGINNRIKRIREQEGLTQKDFSARIGISRSFLSEIEGGKVKPSIEALVGIVLNFQIDTHWLLAGDIEPINEPAVAEAPSGYGGIPTRETVHPVLPILKADVAAGPPRPLSTEDIAEYLPSWGFLTQKKVYCFYLRDDAMSPILPSGSLIGAAPFSGPHKKLEGKLVVVWRKEGLTVRRFRIDPKHIILEAENKSYPVLYLEKSSKLNFFSVDWWWQNQKIAQRG